MPGAKKDVVIFGISEDRVDGILRLNKKALSNLKYKPIDDATLTWITKQPCPLADLHDPALKSEIKLCS